MPASPLIPEAKVQGWPGSFDLLGFTHYWGRSWQGRWVVKRKMAAARLSRALKRMNTWCQRNRHAKVSWQHQQLLRKLRGRSAYYGITGNGRGLRSFCRGTERWWRKWLGRRSQWGRMPWERFKCLLEHYPLAQLRIVHGTVGT